MSYAGSADTFYDSAIISDGRQVVVGSVSTATNALITLLNIKGGLSDAYTLGDATNANAFYSVVIDSSETKTYAGGTLYDGTGASAAIGTYKIEGGLTFL